MHIRVKLYKGNEGGEVAERALRRLKNVEIVDVITEKDTRRESCDILFSASYPHRITSIDRSMARIGAVNIHTGLLPMQRGVNPLNWAIIWGDKMTGVTIHKISDAFDAGDVCIQRALAIGDDNIIQLRYRCFDMFEDAIQTFMSGPQMYLDNAFKQDQAYVTYGPKRFPSESELNLNAEAIDIYNLWRACDPDKYPAFVMEGDRKRIVKRVTKDGKITYAN